MTDALIAPELQRCRLCGARFSRRRLRAILRRRVLAQIVASGRPMTQAELIARLRAVDLAPSQGTISKDLQQIRALERRARALTHPKAKE